MDFAAPKWLWLLVASPAVAVLAAWFWRRRLQATAAWAARGLWNRLFPSYHPSRLRASVALLALAILGLALALARPRWGEGEQQVQRQGIDIVFVLDTSLSMATRDVKPSRLWVGQTLIRRLIRELPGHRVALVQAEGDGVVMVPLTQDTAAVDLLLDAVHPGSLPTPGTEIASALERALNLFPKGSEKHRVMVLVSDGEDHGSELRRVTAQLKETGTVVHAVGVGTPEGQPLELPVQHPDAALEYKRDEAGNVVVSRLVEDTLESLSRETGGIYLRATHAAADYRLILDRISQVETRAFGNETVNSLEERFQWPIVAAMLALCLHLLVSPFGNPSRESA